MKNLGYWIKNGIYLGLIVFFVSMVMGCANTQKTTQKETTTYSTGAAANETEQASGDQESTVVTSETTTTTKTESKDHAGGIISSTFHAIGYVIALPFIIVGGLIQMIF